MIKFATVNLKEIVTVLKGYSDEYSAFAEPRFGSIVEFSDELIEMIDSKKKMTELLKIADEEEIEETQAFLNHRNDFIALSRSVAVDKISVLQEFETAIGNRKIHDIILAYKKENYSDWDFMCQMNHLGLYDSWCEFEEEFYIKIAKNWCYENNLNYD